MGNQCNHDENKICIIHTTKQHCGKCCLKKEMFKNDLVFLCSYPCANVSKEKPNHNCLKCGKPFYPIFFRKNEGWIGGELAQLKLEQLKLKNELSQEK